MRTIVDLTDAQLARLDQVAAREKISRAEAVRRAVDVAYPEGKAAESVWEQRRAAFGIWRDHPVDALEYVDKLRDEWEPVPAGRRRR